MGAGFFVGTFSMILGFAVVWHVWWVAVVGLIGVTATGVIHVLGPQGGRYIPDGMILAIEERACGRWMVRCRLAGSRPTHAAFGTGLAASTHRLKQDTHIDEVDTNRSEDEY